MRVFNVDISRKGISPVVQVTEHDAMSRFFTLVLRDGAADYEEPEGATYSVWYKTADSHGWYDTITEPDNGTHPAVVADGNEYTIEIAEQATTSCGELALCITAPDGYQLTVSGIITRSADIPGYDGEEVENYYNVYITEMRENAARAENAADIAVAYGATVEVDEEAQQLNITHHSDTEGGVGWLFGSAVTSSAEGSVAAFSDGANDVAVKSLVAEITPVQSGTGDPSPTNIRPISGRTGMTVTRTGKNLLDLSGNLRASSNGLTFTPDASDGNKVAISGTASSTWSSMLASQIPITLKAGRTYTFSVGRTIPNSAFIRIVNTDGTNTARVIPANSDHITWTQTADGTTVSEIVLQNLTSGSTVNYTLSFMVEDGASATDYTPYAGQTYPITWESIAGTVYGGTLDVVSGVLTADRKYLSVKWSDFTNKTSLGDYTRGLYYFNDTADTPVYPPSASAPQISNIAPYKAAYAENSLHFYASALAVNMYLPNGASGDTDIVVCYQLATPQTYQLTPTEEVRTLLGGNSIYTDAGAVSVEYVADTKLYIDNKIAELQALVLEN